MKDKEKQIEEMARIIAFDLCPYGKLHAKLYENRAKCASTDNFAECTKINNVVEKLYEQGYRKLPEDSVVLSREEYEKLKGRADNKCRYDCDLIDMPDFEREKTLIEKTSKETAEKFANRLIEIFSTAMGVCSGCALQHDKAKNPTAREFQFGKYKGLEVAIKEVKELAKREGVEI